MIIVAECFFIVVFSVSCLHNSAYVLLGVICFSQYADEVLSLSLSLI
jgi:hypothetical protein